MDPSNLNYANDLWDNLKAVKEQTDNRQKRLVSLKSFLKAYKKALDGFKDGVKKSLVQFEKENSSFNEKKG